MPDTSFDSSYKKAQDQFRNAITRLQSAHADTDSASVDALKKEFYDAGRTLLTLLSGYQRFLDEYKAESGSNIQFTVRRERERINWWRSRLNLTNVIAPIIEGGDEKKTAELAKQFRAVWESAMSKSASSLYSVVSDQARERDRELAHADENLERQGGMGWSLVPSYIGRKIESGLDPTRGQH